MLNDGHPHEGRAEVDCKMNRHKFQRGNIAKLYHKVFKWRPTPPENNRMSTSLSSSLSSCSSADTTRTGVFWRWMRCCEIFVYNANNNKI